ncbi:MAG: glutamyl-tRNA reductase [Candidatus Sumerlaeia bacterium]|nr:glutamyl-tRNA reductase [Candidatus Sumerlaeia bacterium]
MSRLHCFGLNHQSAPLSLLEKLSLAEEDMGDVLRGLSSTESIEEIAGLSTCNRTEFYYVSRHQESARDLLLSRLGQFGGGLQTDDLRYYGYFHTDYHATSHLFRVAAGVDSLMVGESQILGQLRRAWENAQSLGTSRSTLNALLGRAIGFGRRVRSETNIARGNISVAAVAEKLATSTFPDLAQRSVLMLGAGETAELASQHLHKAGVGRLMILNRTLDHSQRLADRFGGTAIAMDMLQSAIEEADIVVAATGAPHYILSQSGLEGIQKSRNGRLLLLIDLSLPRNIEPTCANLDGVVLYSMEDLETISLENRRQRSREIDLVEELIDTETQEFLRAAAAAESNEIIAGLRRKTEEIRLAHLERFSRGLTEEERDCLSRYSDSLVRAVLHDLTSELRASDLETEKGRQRLEAARELFHIEPHHFDPRK